MRLLPPNTYAADPALRSILEARLSLQTFEWASSSADEEEHLLFRFAGSLVKLYTARQR